MKVAVIDFRSRFTDEIERMLEKLGIEYSTLRHDIGPEDLDGYGGFIFTGSLDTVYEGGKLPDERLLDMGKPILGICYGHQVIHHMLGGEVRRSMTPEHVPVTIVTEPSRLFEGLPSSQKVSMHHDDEVTRMAEGFRCIATGEHCRYAATENEDRKIYTVQFHPEDEGNECGTEIFRNFARIVNDEKD